MYRFIFILFFSSGFTSLVFEVIWERALTQVFGTTSLALSTLLTAFMAGLALGSHLGGRFADRIKRPLVVYGLLEGAIGVYALLIPPMLGVLPALYGVLFDHFIDDFVVFSALRFIAVFAILVIPTTMMGATLPLISQWTARHNARFQGTAGVLYAVNTLGACSGALLAGFVLLPALGLSLTNTIFAVSNFVLCATVLAFAAWLPRAEADSEDAEDPDEFDDWESVATTPLSSASRMAIIAGFGLAGFVSMSYQVLWTRAYVIVLGSSTYSFTVILTTFLFAIAAGSALMSTLVHRLSRPAYWLALTQTGFALAATVTFFVMDDLPVWLFGRLREDIGTASEIYLYQFGLVAVVVFVPIFLQGMAFPLVIRALAASRERIGKEVGRAYSLNTVGAITGSFIAGFALLPALGLRASLTVTVAINLLLGFGFTVIALKQRNLEKPAIAALIGLTALATTALLAAPTIDEVKLTRGLFRTYWARQLFDHEKLQRDNPELLFYADGLTATTSVEKRGNLRTLKSNGKPEASDGADMSTQILVALTPFLIRTMNDVPIGNESCAMVGYGSGVTAGAALQWPLERLDVVEIEGTMIEASRFFDHVNHKPLEDPRTRVIESDGRNFLEYTQDTYDVIVSEPSNPWIAGVASLFTVEHFDRARRKLNDRGTFAQWVQLYEIRPENVQVVVATFLESFEHVVAFSSMPKGTDLMLIGSREPMHFPASGFEKAWEDETIRAELERAGIERPMDLYGLMFMNRQELEDFARGAPLNTDDNGLLEFRAPRDLIRYDVGDRFFQKRYFSTERYGDIRPHLNEWPQGWSQTEVADLAIAQWVAGKAPLAREIMREQGLESAEGPPEAPFDSLDQMQLVLHAETLDLDQAVLHIWPSESGEYRELARDASGGEKHLQLIAFLEHAEEPPRGGYNGEKGLLYAWALAQRRYYRHALEQIEGLESRNHPVIDSALFHLVAGFVYSKRRRYNAAFDHYFEASLKLNLRAHDETPTP